MKGARLTGLEGTNPLGFLAALGVQVAYASESRQPRLWWSDDVTPRLVVDDRFSVDSIVDRALSAFAEWRAGPALNPTGNDGERLKKGDSLKLTPPDIRTYIRSTRRGPGADLSTALVAEGSLDNKGAAKPSDLYFTAGQQRFLREARRILEGVTPDDLKVGLLGPWPYNSTLPSLMWDVVDDRVYALTASDPSKDKKRTNPGPEALALLGLSTHPVFAGRKRTLTRGCSGKWTSSYYSWPLWQKPASLPVVKSLLAQTHDASRDNRYIWFGSWGVSTVLRSPVRRSGQGGYGTFGPPEVVWQADASSP